MPETSSGVLIISKDNDTNIYGLTHAKFGLM